MVETFHGETKTVGVLITLLFRSLTLLTFLQNKQTNSALEMLILNVSNDVKVPQLVLIRFILRKI